MSPSVSKGGGEVSLSPPIGTGVALPGVQKAPLVPRTIRKSDAVALAACVMLTLATAVHRAMQASKALCSSAVQPELSSNQ